MAIFTKAKILKGLSERDRDRRNSALGTSIDCYALGKCDTGDNPRLDKIIEDGVETCEIEWSSPHNASIVLGRDRPSHVTSGYGGNGDSHCASIDIVAGRMAKGAKTEFVRDDGTSSRIYAQPNFGVDAARIYLSQKTDVDANFKLAKGKQPYAVARSAVAVKADGIRLVAREGIKLVSGHGDLNSQRVKVSKNAYGIDLIANNDDSDLQPIPKGHNLKEALDEMVGLIDELSGIVYNFMMAQQQFNTAVMGHTHNSPFFGIPVTISPSVSLQGIATTVDLLVKGNIPTYLTKINTGLYRTKYLKPGFKKYINSSFNNTN